jgi:anti-sigma factor RsiW
MFSLGDMVRIVMISSPAPEISMSMAGPCSDWGLVLHAYFDGELDKADSQACELHLEQCQRCSRELRNLKSMRKKSEGFHHRVGCAGRLAKSNSLIAHSERALQIVAEEGEQWRHRVRHFWGGNHGSKNWIFWE